ncbi:MAG: hypothetical protein AAFZ65_14220, partial [Planctomycetota bacterium]
SVLAVLGLTIATSTTTMRDMAFSSTTQDQLQLQARRAMQAISADLRRAADATLDTDGNELQYPLIYDSNGIDPLYLGDDHTFQVVPKLAEAGDADFGVDEGILFCVPADANGDGSPDFNLATGTLTWDTGARVSFSRQLSADGRPALVRTVDGGAQRVIARDVELLQFDVNSIATPEVPLDAVRVRIGFRATSRDGHQYRHRTEFLVLMRSNG